MFQIFFLKGKAKDKNSKNALGIKKDFTLIVLLYTFTFAKSLPCVK